MPKDVDNWESQIKVVYAAGSPQCKTLFPKGKGPFNTGSQQKRVNAVAALLLSIGSDASLAAVKAIIQTFYDAMFAAFNTKGVSKKSTKTDSTATELARTNMCNMMEGNYGLILDTFKDEPTLGSKYFDEAYMSSHLQMSFAFKLKILSTRNILKRTFANPLTQQLQIINNSNTTLYMFLAVRKLGVVGTVFVTILPLSTTTHLLTEFGNPATDKFLKIYNTDNKIKADVVVNVL